MSSRMTSFWFRVCETTLLLLAFLLPLAFFLKTYDGTAIKTTLFETGAVVLAFAWLFKGLERGRWELSDAARPLALPALALLVWTIARYFDAPYKLAALPDFLKQVLCLLTYLVVLLESGGTSNARRFFGLLTAAAWIAGLYALAQRFGFDPFSWKTAFGDKVFGTLGDPASLGFFLSLCVPLALTQWLDPERDEFLRWSDLALLLLIFFDVQSTRSLEARYDLLRACAASAVILPLCFPSRASWKAAGIAAALLLADAVGGFAGGGFAELFKSYGQGVESSLALIARSPAVGFGPGSFGVLVHAAPTQDGGLFLRTAAELGAAGALLWLWLIGALAAAFWRAHREFNARGALSETCYGAGLGAAALSALLCSYFGPGSRALAATWLFWPLAGMLGGLTTLAKRGAYVSVLPLPLREAARRRLYAPALLVFSGLAFMPLQWLDSEIEQNTGMALASARRYEEAIAHFERVRPGAESYVASRYRKGNALLEMGRAQDALQTYAAVESLSPDYARVHYGQALADLRLGEWKDAVLHFERQQALEPDFTDIHLGWAQAAQRLGELGVAEHEATLAIMAKPGDGAARALLEEIVTKEARIAQERRLGHPAAKVRGGVKKKPQG